jgi:diguanylate cyclase (GGDEF)-like protein
MLVCTSIASARAQTSTVPAFSPAATRGAVALADVALEIEAPPPGTVATPVQPAHAVFRFRLIGDRHVRRYVLYGTVLTAEIDVRYRLGTNTYVLRTGTDVPGGTSDVAGRPVSLQLPEAAWDAPYVDVAVDYAARTALPKIDTLRRLTDRSFDEQKTSFAFLGFFIAIGLFNAILSLMLRDASFAWYGTAMGIFALRTAFISGIPHGWTRTPLEEEIVRTILLWSSFAAVTQFACVFLTLRRASRPLYYTILALLAVTLFGIAGESCLGDAWPFFILDEVLQDGLLAALVFAGISMARQGLGSARFFLVAFAGVAAGIVVGDLSEHGLIAGGSFLIDYSLDIGIAIEALFLALALADRTHRLDEERRRLEVLIDVDALTGLANRRGFDEAMGREWQRNARAVAPLAMLMIDVDRFKKYNDRFGHPAGDEVLRRVAGALRATIRRAEDTAARYGGEEFALILSATNADDASLLAERCRVAVEALAIAHPANPTGVVTISVGVAVAVPVYDASPMALIIEADGALYRAKAGGRNRVFTSASYQTA